MSDPDVLYFAYGSNADPDRFRDRVGDWGSRRPALLRDHRLRFADRVRSEGGGGAVIDPAPGEVVDGVLFGITAEQLAAMDREEFDPSRDRHGTGRRVRLEVEIDGATVEAEAYTVEDDGAWHPPSATYLGFILRGLEAAGHGPEASGRVRAAAERAQVERREADTSHDTPRGGERGTGLPGPDQG